MDQRKSACSPTAPDSRCARLPAPERRPPAFDAARAGAEGPQSRPLGRTQLIHCVVIGARPSDKGAMEPMSYALFRAAITEPALLQIAAHWHAARGDRLMPAWRDIDACALAPHLPIVWSWRYDF